MSILFFRSLFISWAMLNICDLNAMNSSMDLEAMDIEDEFFTLADLETTPEILFQVQTLFDFEREYLLPCEVSKIILDDFTQLWIAKLSQYLKANNQTPEEILKLIKQLLRDYQFDVSVNVLRLAFENASMWIGDIMDIDDRTCLHVACKDAQYFDCIKLMLCVAHYKAWDFISMLSFAGWSAWHEVVCDSDINSIAVFINWAIDNKRATDLFSLETSSNQTAWQVASGFKSNDHVEILKGFLRCLRSRYSSSSMI